LFPSGPLQEFTCFLYVLNETTGDPPEVLSFTTSMETITFEEKGKARRLGVHRATRQQVGKTGNKVLKAKPTLHSGDEICQQRWTLLRFLKPSSDELWFCYMPEGAWPQCEEKLVHYDMQGFAFLGASLLLLSVIAYVMRHQTQFTICIEWLAVFILNMAVAFAGVKYLIDRDMDFNRMSFSATAMAIVISGSNLLYLPYAILKWCDVSNTLSLLYLLIVAYSPCVFLDRMSYYQSLPLLMGHQPALLGFFGFSVEVLKYMFCSASQPSSVEIKTQQQQPLGSYPNYIPMYQQ